MRGGVLCAPWTSYSQGNLPSSSDLDLKKLDEEMHFRYFRVSEDWFNDYISHLKSIIQHQRMNSLSIYHKDRQWCSRCWFQVASLYTATSFALSQVCHCSYELKYVENLFVMPMVHFHGYGPVCLLINLPPPMYYVLTTASVFLRGL